MLDLCIRGGSIVDGSGKDAYISDIGIKDGKIHAMGNLSEMKSTQDIEATGYVVSPGFIDVHTHSDTTIFLDPRCVSQIRQGVTTQIVGLCGVSMAPANDKIKQMMSAQAFFGMNIEWDSFESYLNKIQSISPATNIGSFVGHGTLRSLVMQNPIAIPTEEEMQSMVQALDTALKEGAFGLSTGLEYNPGKASELSELEILCQVVVKHNAIHTCHTRNRDKHYCTAVCEILDIARATGVNTNISHINPKYGRHDSTMADLLALIDYSRKQGIRVTFDIMPSEYNHTSAMALMPLWANGLNPEDFAELLSSPEGCQKLKHNPSPVWQLAAQDKWERIYHFGGDKTIHHVGQSIADIAKEFNCTGWEAVCKLLLIETPAFNSIILASDAFSLDDSRLGLSDPYSAIGSDVVGLATDGPLAERVFSVNTYDWIPAFFKNFVHSTPPFLSLEKAIHKLTGNAAWLIGIEDRGLLVPNYAADILIFDPKKIKSTVTLKNPKQYTKGMNTVIVNGKIAYKEGDDSIHCFGKALRARLGLKL